MNNNGSTDRPRSLKTGLKGRMYHVFDEIRLRGCTDDGLYIEFPEYSQLHVSTVRRELCEDGFLVCLPERRSTSKGGLANVWVLRRHRDEALNALFGPGTPTRAPSQSSPHGSEALPPEVFPPKKLPRQAG